MKPSPQYDFTISVRRHSWEEEPEVAAWYEGIFEVTLNFTVNLMFVPALKREPWPPRLPEDTDAVHTEQEARSIAISLSRYAATPDDSREGTEERFARDWSESGPGVVFYVTSQEFATFSEELARLADERPSVHSGWKVSEIPQLAVTRWLLTRVLASPSVSAKDLRMLGR